MKERRVCTCGGTAPGYPQHESYCIMYANLDRLSEEEEQEIEMEQWLTEVINEGPPEDREL